MSTAVNLGSSMNSTGFPVGVPHDLFTREMQSLDQDIGASFLYDPQPAYSSNTDIAIEGLQPTLANIANMNDQLEIPGNARSNPETPTQLLNDVDPKSRRNSISYSGFGEYDNLASMPDYIPDGQIQDRRARYVNDASTDYLQRPQQDLSSRPVHVMSEIRSMTPDINYPNSLAYQQQMFHQPQNGGYSLYSTDHNVSSSQVYYQEFMPETRWQPINMPTASTDPANVNFPGVEKADILTGKIPFDLCFKSLQEARSMNRAIDTLAPEEDPTYPRTPEEERKYVQRLYNAMINMEKAEDNDGLQRTWRSMMLDEVKVERAAWELLNLFKDRHQFGKFCKTMKIQDEFDEFEKRFTKVEHGLQTQKAMCKHLIQQEFIEELVEDPLAVVNRIVNNRKVNFNKKKAIEEGRKALGGFEDKNRLVVLNKAEGSANEGLIENEEDEHEEVRLGTPPIRPKTPPTHPTKKRLTPNSKALAELDSTKGLMISATSDGGGDESFAESKEDESQEIQRKTDAVRTAKKRSAPKSKASVSRRKRVKTGEA